MKDEKDEVGILPIVTLVLWVGCAVVGLIGMLPAVPAQPPATQPGPTEAALLDVDLTQDATPADVGPAPPNAAEQFSAVPAAPPMPAVAQPSPAIAFARPVEGPVRIVAAKEANAVATVAVPAAPSAPVQQLVFGQGDGSQPKPPYPIEDKIEHHTGVVMVRFNVGEDGGVTDAQVITPCPWPGLNQSALRTIRQRWHFPQGPARIYECSVTFQDKPK